jgi:hypothetical protein
MSTIIKWYHCLLDRFFAASFNPYFLALPLALNVFNGSTFPFLPLTTFFLPPPLTNFLLPGFGMFKPTKPTSSGFLPPGNK